MVLSKHRSVLVMRPAVLQNKLEMLSINMFLISTLIFLTPAKTSVCTRNKEKTDTSALELDICPQSVFSLNHIMNVMVSFQYLKVDISLPNF